MRQYSFSDSVGDDLFLVVQDSTGKYCGCVVAQIDTFIEEPVVFLLVGIFLDIEAYY